MVGGVNSCPKQGKKNCVFLVGFCGWMQAFDEHVRKEKLDMPGCPAALLLLMINLSRMSKLYRRLDSNRLKRIVFDELMKCLSKYVD